MKQIKNVSAKGIEYLNESGNSQFIDFKICYNNWLAKEGIKLGESPDDVERARQIEQKWKCVGQRDLYAKPAYIELSPIQ